MKKLSVIFLTILMALFCFTACTNDGIDDSNGNNGGTAFLRILTAAQKRDIILKIPTK